MIREIISILLHFKKTLLLKKTTKMSSLKPIPVLNSLLPTPESEFGTGIRYPIARFGTIPCMRFLKPHHLRM